MYISYWHELLIVIFRKFDFHLDLMINVYNVQLNACLYFYHTFTNYLSHKFTQLHVGPTCKALLQVHKNSPAFIYRGLIVTMLAPVPHATDRLKISYLTISYLISWWHI